MAILLLTALQVIEVMPPTVDMSRGRGTRIGATREIGVVGNDGGRPVDDEAGPRRFQRERIGGEAGGARRRRKMRVEARQRPAIANKHIAREADQRDDLAVGAELVEPARAAKTLGGRCDHLLAVER